MNTFFHYCPHRWQYRIPTLFLCSQFLQIIKPTLLAFCLDNEIQAYFISFVHKIFQNRIAAHKFPENL